MITVDKLYEAINIDNDIKRKEINESLSQDFLKELEEVKPSIEFTRKYEEAVNKLQKEKEEFYANPLHWSNNKRRRYGLQTLRGRVNKTRKKVFNYYDPYLFIVMEEIVDSKIKNEWSNEFFNQFVETKHIARGDEVDGN